MVEHIQWAATKIKHNVHQKSIHLLRFFCIMKFLFEFQTAVAGQLVTNRGKPHDLLPLGLEPSPKV
jgi:hypothetical protein